MDFLQEVSDSELCKLEKLYKSHLPYALHIYNFIKTAVEVKKRKTENKLDIKILTLDGKISAGGTFLGLVQNFSYDFILFTLERSCDTLYEALMNTKYINPKENMTFYAVYYDHTPVLLSALKELEFPLHLYKTGVYDVWWIQRDTASNSIVELSEDLYIEKLTSRHARAINDVWPHRYPSSEGYIASFIDTTGGYGLFSKSSNCIVSWALRNHMGALAFLQTAEGHMKKGYGAIIAKHVTKMIAKAGYHPVALIARDNIPSRKTFAKLGFEIQDTVTFIER